MANALDVARFLIQLRDNDEANGQYFSLSNLKLQKLLYYCQGGHYLWDNEPLVVDYLFEPWEYGPVIRDIYWEFKKFGQNDIRLANIGEIDLKPNEMDTIRAVWEELKGTHAFDLVRWTHEEAPWINASNNNDLFINELDIQQYFRQEEAVN